ncbi:hypothetical protein CRM93_11460 [Acetobacter fabarum]|uniref:Uncharacterized protein n=1 Tax=Acetobacter fabarum TaxID=483199 RepID=A0A269XV07_9PROT|nr:hypothetical protein B8X00_11580 [Acetobacter fabarum]PEN23701.1 hypothetical protein CRM93_11460 [Acetobacter fabarum]
MGGCAVSNIFGVFILDGQNVLLVRNRKGSPCRDAVFLAVVRLLWQQGKSLCEAKLMSEPRGVR